MEWKGAPVRKPVLTLNLFDDNTQIEYPCINGPLDATTATKSKKKPLFSNLRVLNGPSGVDELVLKCIQNRSLFVDGNAICLRTEPENEDLKDLQEALCKIFTVSPYTSRYQKRKIEFSLYSLYKNAYIFPKIPFLMRYPQLSVPKTETVTKADETNPYFFDGQLRPYQQPCVKHVVAQLSVSPHAGVLNAQPGAGKTVMIMSIISQLQCPAMIVVHTQKLMEQFQSEVKRWLPNASIGILKGKQRPTKNTTVCIASLQTLMRRKFKEIDRRFKAVFFDETHHIAAATFSKCLFAIQPKYVLGCTGTLDRADKLSAWIEVLVGPLLYQIKAHVQADVLPVVYHHKQWVDPVQRWPPHNKDYVSALTKLCTHRHRTRTIAKVINKLVKEKRRIICIASRQVLCKELYEVLARHNVDAGCVTGDFSSEDALTKQVLIGIDKLLGEGFNDPTRSCIVLCTPYKGVQKVAKKISTSGRRGGANLIQICGRALRGKTKHVPLIVDVQDSGTMFESMKYSRFRYYADMKWTIRDTINVNEP